MNLPPFLLHLKAHHFLVCTICEHTLFTNDLASHALQHLPPRADIASLRATINSLALQSPGSAYEVIKAQQPVRPLQGLPIRDGHLCSECDNIFISEVKACQHLGASHNIRGRANQLQALRACKIQGLQSNRYLFKVTQGSQ